MKINSNFRTKLYAACTWIEAIAVTLTNRLKFKLGIKVQPNSHTFFLRQFLLHELGRQQPLHITCKDRIDGAGAQAHNIISAMSFARAYGHQYVHTPFKQIDHADRPMEQWVMAWEELFKLGSSEKYAHQVTAPIINYSNFHPRLYYRVLDTLLKLGRSPSDDISTADSGERLFQPYLYHSDSHPDSYTNVIPELRIKYGNIDSCRKSNHFKVAIHMRRGDVRPGHTERYTPTEQVCETVYAVKSILENKKQPFSLAVYSQGGADEFRDLQNAGAELYLDADPVWTMQQLIDADCLIMSKSSFSYVAALIGQGIKIYEPFWHSPIKDWIVCRSDGQIEASEFESLFSLASLDE